jgi:hypothetical protein
MADSGYMIRHDGALRTLRYDNEKRFPDLTNSHGVIGYLKYQDALYVHLNGQSQQLVYLQDNMPQEVYLKYGSHYVDNWLASKNEVTFAASGTGKASFEIANLIPDNQYQINIKHADNDDIMESKTIVSNESGNLSFDWEFPDYMGKYQINIKKNMGD